MDQPGRKSAAGLSVVRVTASDRPEPPEYMAEWQRALWRSVTATKPADWFTDDTLPLLEAYVAAAWTHRTVTLAMQTFESGHLADPDMLKNYHDLHGLQKGAAGTLASLAVKMRLAQSARYGARGASGAHERTLKTAKPWET
jgi:hypothetical protein